MLRLGSTEGAAYLPDEAKAFVSALLFKRRAKRREREEEGVGGLINAIRRLSAVCGLLLCV